VLGTNVMPAFKPMARRVQSLQFTKSTIREFSCLYYMTKAHGADANLQLHRLRMNQSEIGFFAASAPVPWTWEELKTTYLCQFNQTVGSKAPAG
jgi:hypothetical protein